MTIASRRLGLVLGAPRALSAIILLICMFSACTSGIRNKDPKIRIAAVEKLTDQSLLAKVVFEDQDELVREAAVLRLTDQVILAKIATEHKVGEVQFTAIARLTDTATLEKIVTNDKEAILLRQFANRRLEQLTGTHRYSFH
jgi:hypothetical protein